MLCFIMYGKRMCFRACVLRYIKRRSSSHTNRQENTFLDPNPASKNLIGRGLRIQKHRDYTFCGPPWPPLPTIPPVHQHTPNQACVAPSRSVGMFSGSATSAASTFLPPTKDNVPEPPDSVSNPRTSPLLSTLTAPNGEDTISFVQPKFQY